HLLTRRSERDRGPLVLEPAQCGVLDRSGLRVLRVDLHDVAVPVRLVAVAAGAGVETRFDALPTQGGVLVAEPVAAFGLAGAFGAEVAVEVLLPGQDDAPRCGAAGAVGHQAAHRPTRGVLLGHAPPAARGRSGQGHGR